MGCQSIFNFILYCEHFYVSQFIININQLHSTSLTSLCFFFTFLVLIPNFLSIPLHISCWSVAVNTTHYKSPVLPFLMENVPAKDSSFSVTILSSWPPVASVLILLITPNAIHHPSIWTSLMLLGMLQFRQKVSDSGTHSPSLVSSHALS